MAVLVDMAGACAGLICTASHNPQEWNGLKVLVPDHAARAEEPSACAPSKAVADSIVEIFRGGATLGVASWRDLGQIEAVQEADLAGPVHAVRVHERLSKLGFVAPIRKAKFHVAQDCVGGSGAIMSPDFLEGALACRVELEGDYTDGLFTHTPEPTRENLTGLCKLVKKKKAAIGFAQDPDADRLAIVDERGTYIGEEYTLVLAAEALLGAGTKARRHAGTKGKRRESVLVTNLSTSRMIDDVAAKYGARVVRTAVGEANVVEAMKREKAAGNRVVLGGEGNGGVIWPEVTYVRDSLSGMALVLSLMARTGKTVSELVEEMPAYAIDKRKVEIPRKEHARPAVEKLAAEYAGQKLDLQDGVRVDWVEKRAWLHVRASNTEPIMRLIAEAPTAAEAGAILDEAARVIAG